MVIKKLLKKKTIFSIFVDQEYDNNNKNYFKICGFKNFLFRSQNPLVFFENNILLC